MKVKEFLIELNKYKDKKVTSEKEGLLITYKDTYPTSPKDILLTLESMYVNSESKWDVLHGVLTIEDGSYTIGSGHCDYTTERYNLLSKDKGLLLEIDATKLNTEKLFFKERMSTVSDEVKTGELYVRVPLISNMKNVIKYYQQKWPNKNYTLDRKTIKKKLSERSQKLADLPKLSETPAKELRKVCYKHKEGTVIFRGSYVNAKKHVDSGDYEFVSKTAWKRQIVNDEDKVIRQREANISNIIQSPLGRDLREKKDKREANKASKEEIRYKKLMQKYARRNGQRKPGDAERKLQSDKDKNAYAEKCKLSKKKRISHPVSRSYETVIIGKNGKTLPPLFIKATSIEHATKQLNIILKQKSAKSGKLTNVRDWIKSTGNYR